MRILVTHELFLPDLAGGGERIVYEYVKRLVRRGHDVTVLTSGDPKICEYEGIKTVRLPIPRYLFNLAVPWVLKYAKNVDIIQTNNYNAALPSFIAGKLLHKPVVCIVHGVYGRRWKSMRHWPFNSLSAFMEKLQLGRKYDRVIFYSDFAREQGREIGVDGEVFYLGSNPESFRPSKKEKYVLFVGRLEKQKGIDTLLEAARKLPDIRFKLVGRGDLKDIPPNVDILGFKDGTELHDLFAHALVFCLPSVAETFGLVILEAMAAGCAVVSTVPLDYRGATIAGGDADGLARELSKLLKNPSATEKLGLENVKIAAKYDWEKFVDSLEAVYRSLA